MCETSREILHIGIQTTIEYHMLQEHVYFLLLLFEFKGKPYKQVNK